MMVKNKKGQSTLEYIILVTAVIALLLIFLRPNGGVFTNALNTTLDTSVQGMSDMAERLNSSRPLSPQ